MTSPAYTIIRYEVSEIKYGLDGDGRETKDDFILEKFLNRETAYRYYEENRGLKDIRVDAVCQYEDGHIEYAQIRGISGRIQGT